MEYWRHIAVATLAKEPQEWRPLGQIFCAVADAIPMHLALRRAATRERQRRQRAGDDSEVRADQLDLGRAQWQVFIQFLLPMLERQSERKMARRDELVRLKPSPTPCQDCAGPIYLTGWGGRNIPRAYACPACTAAPPAVEPPPEPIRPTLVVVPQEPAPPPAETRPPLPPVRLMVVRPPPPPRQLKDFRELAELISLGEIREEFFWTMGKLDPDFPRLGENRKLRWTLHRALEAGAGREYQQMAYSLSHELQLYRFKSPNHIDLDKVIDVNQRRAMEWITERTPSLTKEQRSNWENWITKAYHFSALCVVSIMLAGRLATIRYEMEKLLVELEPPKRKQREARIRWLAPLKNNFRFRIH